MNMIKECSEFVGLDEMPHCSFCVISQVETTDHRLPREALLRGELLKGRCFDASTTSRGFFACLLGAEDMAALQSTRPRVV